MTTPSKPPCFTCANSKEWHEANPHVMHKFNDGSLPTSATFGKPRDRNDQRDPKASQRPSGIPEMPPVHQWPHDPVLRMALIDAGVLTPDDLRRAEDKIRMVTREVMESGQQQGGTEGVRLPEQA